MRNDGKRLLELAALDKQWKKYPGKEGEIERDFLHFPAGTSHTVVCQWFENQYGEFSTSLEERWFSGGKAGIDEGERLMAEQEIADNGYCGYIAGGLWRCIGHTVEYLDGDWSGLLALAIGKLTDLPDGVESAWHDDSSQYLTSIHDHKEGIHCEVIEEGEECAAEIYPADESWDEDEEDEENA